MNANPLHDPKHWRKRADATRAKADLLADQAARQKLLRVALEYEQLAQRAEHPDIFRAANERLYSFF